MSSEERPPSAKSRSSKTFGSFAKSGVTMASDGVASVVKPFSSVAKASAKASGKAVKASGNLVHGTVKASGKAVSDTANALNPTKMFKKSSKHKTEKQSLYEDLHADPAESYLIEGLEERGRRTVPNGDGFRPAVEGERAPFGLHSLGRAFDEEAPLTTQSAPNYRSMARMARQQSQKFSFDANDPSNDLNLKPSPMNSHQRAQTLLDSINDDEEDENNPNNKSPMEEVSFPGGPMEINVDESHPLLGGEGLDPLEGIDGGGYHDPSSGAPYQRLNEARRGGPKRRCQNILACLNPLNLIRNLLKAILLPFLAWYIPLFIISWVLFYYCGNPELDFMPGEATISWWINFFGRQCFLLQVSYILQTILIDWIILSSRLVLAIVGPWATMFCLQSRGWPFLVGSWGLLAMVFLHGDDAFSQHWLHFTGIKIFTTANSGTYIIASSTYLRVLIGMVLAGIATSLKRTIVTLYFGKRSFDIYKTKLEKILNNVILVSEVAELSAAAEDLEGMETSSRETPPRGARRSGPGHVRWSSLRFEDRKKMRNSPQQPVDELSDSDGSNDDEESEGHDSDKSDASEVKPAESKDDKSEEEDDMMSTENRIDPSSPFNKSYSSISADTSVKHFKMKNQLGRWDDPLNKMDAKSESSVSDILKFRKALTYMDLEHPFSESFGPASSRDELLTSAQAVYSRLRRLSPEGSATLPLSVLAVLAENEDGSVDKQTRRSLKKIFPPDRMGNVSLFSFVMGCDSVYKKLRYFRASVGNSSVIDKVLEDIVDTLFFFVLVILILSLLNLNPWPLLVSTSTLMVTFAFALGPSAAKAIEGMILIVGRRPYDIGDRIIISNTPGEAVPGVANSWFVEDITLFTTTIRFGANNELATLSNGSIAQSRITNCARSKKATVHLVLKLHIRFHEGSNLADYREALDTYVLNNPNRWDSIVFFRCEEIDADNEFVVYRLVTRSTQSWQPAPRVLEHRSQLHRFMLDLAKRMEVQFNAPLPSSVIYSGGDMKDITNPKINRARDLEASSAVLPMDVGSDTDEDPESDGIHQTENAARRASTVGVGE